MAWPAGSLGRLSAHAHTGHLRHHQQRRFDGSVGGRLASAGGAEAATPRSRAVLPRGPLPMVGRTGRNVGSVGRAEVAVRVREHLVSFHAARTIYFDAYFAAAADAGVRQVVIFAVRLDSRALPLAVARRHVRLRAGSAPPPRLQARDPRRIRVLATAARREVPVDLRDDWPRALKATGFDPSRRLAWIVEGLLVYLPATAQRQLFARSPVPSRRDRGPPWMSGAGQRLHAPAHPPLAPSEDGTVDPTTDVHALFEPADGGACRKAPVETAITLSSRGRAGRCSPPLGLARPPRQPPQRGPQPVGLVRPDLLDEVAEHQVGTAAAV